jgi:hypothetical protein
MMQTMEQMVQIPFLTQSPQQEEEEEHIISHQELQVVQVVVVD